MIATILLTLTVIGEKVGDKMSRGGNAALDSDKTGLLILAATVLAFCLLVAGQAA